MQELCQTEFWLKTEKEMNRQITDWIAVQSEIDKVFRDIMENPKK